jgi:hypothetical protein
LASDKIVASLPPCRLNAGEGRHRLVSQPPFLPQPAGLVDELLELRGWRAEPRRRPERERIGPRQVINRGLGDRRCGVGVPPPQRILVDRAVGRQLRDPPQPYLGPGRGGTLGDGLCERVHSACRAVVDDGGFHGHVCLPHMM